MFVRPVLSFVDLEYIAGKHAALITKIATIINHASR
jgi:hypothetical protein